MSYLNYLHAGSLVILHSKRAVTVVPIACVGCPASRIARQEGSMTISSSSCNSTTANNKLSRKRQRPPNRSCSSNSQFLPGHVCKGGLSVLLIALLRCPGSAASQAGGGSPGGSFGNPGPPQRRGLHGEPEGLEWVQWTYQYQATPGATPFTPFGSAPTHFVQRPDPMASIRALAMAIEEEERTDVASYVAMVLQKLANMNELFLGERARKDTVFHSASMPSVAVAEFVERVANNVRCPNLCLMLTLVYMDRLALPSSELHLYITPLTAHRLFAASLIIAIKFIAETPPSIFDDKFYEKMHSVTGLSVAELKHLEHHMLQALSKDAYVSTAEMNRYMVNFAPKHDELVPYVDRPYMGPPPFPFQ